jgi:hypothetical protein
VLPSYRLPKFAQSFLAAPIFLRRGVWLGSARLGSVAVVSHLGTLAFTDISDLCKIGDILDSKCFCLSHIAGFGYTCVW